jgi:galactoside O-acetyltransferase
MRRLVRELRAFADAIVSAWPGGSGYMLRRWYVPRRLGECGPEVMIDPRCTFLAPANIRFGRAVGCGSGAFFAADGGAITVGDFVTFNTNVHVNASLGLRIELGNNVLVGPNVVLRSADHRFDRIDVPIRSQGHTPAAIVIEDDVWLGANVVVVGGVRIGRGAVVAAGAVVTRDVPSMAVVGGVPARVLKMRGSVNSV